MGVYHQGGIVPTQIFLSKQLDVTQAVWWKTYSPPIWLLNGKNNVLTTHDLMGMKGDLMIENLGLLANCHDESAINSTYLIAPTSATFLDTFTGNNSNGALAFEKIWGYDQHLNLDDLEFGEDGVWNTLERLIGRRGIIAWRVTKGC